uniref:E3 ubiquitin-protein ligase n=1 Tax=Gongylonema pulchrum TaxID=637853 RepID=A0A183E146_9BILA
LRLGLQKSTITLVPDHFYENTPPATTNGELFNWLVYSMEMGQPLRKASYWTLVSDLQNLLMHGEISRRFLRSEKCMKYYRGIVEPMQGMNLNYRVISGDHLEYDTAQSYQIAFHLELEITGLNMFNMLAALTNETECDCLEFYISKWKAILEEWFDAINLKNCEIRAQPFCISYHIPLHRHIAAAVLRVIEVPALAPSLKILIEDEIFLRKALLYPLRIQVCRAETLAGMWTRNGNSIRNQAFYYVQTSYIAAFLDCDITLIRFIASFIDTEWFMEALCAAFYMDDCWLLFELAPPDFMSNSNTIRIITRIEWVDFMVDGLMRLLLDILVVRWNAPDKTIANIEREIIAALAVADLTHSKLRALIPEKGSRPSVDDKTFDKILEKVATYCEPDQGSQIEQGLYTLTTATWRHHFDPAFCRMRATTALHWTKLFPDLYQQSNPVDTVLSVFTCPDDLSVGNGANGEALTDCILKQMDMDSDELNCISGFAIDYIGRLLCLLHQNCESVRDALKQLIDQHRIQLQETSGEPSRKQEVDSPMKSARRSAAKRHQEVINFCNF